MGGMGTGLQTNNPTVVSAFHAALVRQGLVVLLIVAVVGVAWRVLRARQLRRSTTGETPSAGLSYPEPAGRRLLRVSFGLIWIFDGILQGQASMPLGMTTGVIQPAAAASPPWVQHLDNAGATIWSYHPIAAPAAAVWIQIGIGLWLLAAPRGDWSRLGGVASVGWGMIVWIFGEAFGGIFAPGLTWLFGAPGAVLFYCLAGVLIALPERYWATPRLGRIILRGLGLFFVAMAVLQAWPGRGFWQGQPRHAATPGTLTAMVQQMAHTPQPHLLSSWAGELRRLRRRPRLGREPGRGDRPGRHRGHLPDRPAPTGPTGRDSGGGALPGRLGAHRGLRVLRWGRHRPQQHDPHGAALHGRLPGHHPAARRRR